jgi:hypothetical protein
MTVHRNRDIVFASATMYQNETIQSSHSNIPEITYLKRDVSLARRDIE